MTSKIQITLGTKDNTELIDHIRHDVYAAELGQFDAQPDGTLHDRPEVGSIYLVAYENEGLVGFVGITPPTSPAYSIDHYIERGATGLEFDEGLFEIRALTVIDQSRGTRIAPALMYAAFRWVQDNGGTQLVAIGHSKVRDMYIRLGMRPQGNSFCLREP